MKKLYTLALMCLFMLTAAAEDAAVQITADPADGSTVEKLSSVTITFGGVTTVDQGSKASDVTITSDKGYSAGCTLGYGAADNQMVVSFTEVTAEATYTLNFPENAFSADTAIPAFTLTYTIGQEQQEGLVFSPAPGTVTWLTDIIATVAADPSLNFYSDANGEKPYILDSNGEKVVVDASSLYDSNAGRSFFHIIPRLLITTPGEYTLVIPENSLYYNDASWQKVYLPSQTAKYNLIGGETAVFTSSPSKDEPVSRFKDLIITFPNNTNVTYNSTRSITLYQNAETWKGSGSLNYNFTYEGNTMKFSVYSEIIDAGHYTMTFPEGCLLLDDEPSAPFMVEFDIVENEPLNMVVTPAEGASVEGILNSAVITFPDETDVTYNPGSIYLYRLNGENKVTVGSAYGATTTVKQDDGKTFKVSFNGIATVSGTYQLAVPKNLFAAGDSFNAETTVTFTYTAPEAPTMVVTPAEGAELDRVQNFTVTFPDEEEVNVNTALSSSITLYKGIPYYSEYGYLVATSQSTCSLSAITKTEGKGNEFTFSFSNPGIEAGEYTLAIPAGIFLVGDRTFNATDTLVYTATGNGLDKIEATPSEPVSSLKNITLTFTDETSVTFQSAWASATFYMVNPEQTYDTYKENISATKSDWNGYVYIDETSPNTLIIELKDEYTEAGEYYISLSNYFLFMSDGTTPNTINKVYFTIDPTTSVKGVTESAVDAATRVYTIGGVEVKATDRPGLYIKNGKKVLVK